MRALIIAGIALTAIACGAGGNPPAVDLPPWRFIRDANGEELRVLEKAPYTYFYALDGTVRRLAVDSNGDRRPDVLAYFSGKKTPDQVQVDDNFDGHADLWEEYGTDGVLVRFATATKGGVPDTFVEVDPATGARTRVETDADGDGLRERLETFEKGRLRRAEMDTDGDGKRDRFQDWKEGYLSSEELDQNQDGRADIRILRTSSGAISRVERLSR